MLPTLLGGLLATAFVLVLIGLGGRGMRRLFPGMVAGAQGVPMQVVQRLALSPRQGVALVRVGERVVALSTGEGGVRRLFELDEADAERLVPREAAQAEPAAIATPSVAAAAVVAAPTGAEAFRAALATATNAARMRIRGLIILAAALAIPARAHAQAPVVAEATAAPDYAQLPASARQAVPPANAGAATPRTATVLPPRAAQAVPTPAPQAPPQAPRATTPTPQAAPATPTPQVAPRATLPGQRGAPGAATAPRDSASAGSAADIVTRLAPQMDLRVGNGAEGGLRLSGTVGVVVMMGLLTTLPMLVLMMTSFTRVFIVFQFVRQGLGTQTAPPSQLIAALALILTGFIMAPTLGEVNRTALEPWMNGEIQQVEMMRRGAEPLRAFMLRQVRPADVRTFVRLSRQRMPATAAEVPLVTLMAAFATSELRTAFSIGFMVFLPFIIIDFAVSSVLMSLGMFMLPPALISLPFKLLLFVLVDGWALIMQSLVASFH